MKNTFLRFLTTAASALVLTTVISFADEPAKKDGDGCPACPATPEAPKSLIVGHCGTCDKKDKPEVTPEAPKSMIVDHCGTCDKKDKPEVTPAEPAKQEDAPAKKDGDKCCPASPEAPKS